MKYIDADKLIAEIERRKDEWQALINKNNAVNPTAVKEVICEDLNILDIVNFLQQEQPEVNLEKEIEDYWEKICDDEFGELIPRVRETVWFDNIARHFYELGLNARKEE